MKLLKLVVLVLAFTFNGFAQAETKTYDGENPTAFSKEIKSLLGNHDFSLNQDLNAKVTFVVNNENELVVLSVETQDQILESFIKSRLNYKKIKANLKQGLEYHLPVRIGANA